eukprot:IDg17892t1
MQRRISGIGGNMEELDELLIYMRQARDDVLATKAAEKTAQRERDKKNDRIGMALVESATKKKLTDSGSPSEAEEIRPTSKKLKARYVRAALSIEMSAFNLNQSGADLARVTPDCDRLQFEHERSEAVLEELELERERERERER